MTLRGSSNQNDSMMSTSRGYGCSRQIQHGPSLLLVWEWLFHPTDKPQLSLFADLPHFLAPRALSPASWELCCPTHTILMSNQTHNIETFFLIWETERKLQKEITYSLFASEPFPSLFSEKAKMSIKTEYDIYCRYYYHPCAVKGIELPHQGCLFYLLCFLFPFKSSLHLHFSEQYLDCFYHFLVQFLFN